MAVTIQEPAQAAGASKREVFPFRLDCPAIFDELDAAEQAPARARHDVRLRSRDRLLAFGAFLSSVSRPFLMASDSFTRTRPDHATMVHGMIHELVTEELDRADDGIRRGIAQRAKTPASHIATDIVQQRDIRFTPMTFFWVVLLVLAAGVFVAHNLRHGATGRAFAALRDSQPTAQSSGIDVARYRVAAFALSTLYAGIAGALFAHWSLYVSAASFGLSLSILFIAMIVVGGLDSVAGSILGAAFLTAVQEALQNAGQAQLADPLFGAIIVVALLFLPPGLIGVATLLRRHHGRRLPIMARGSHG